MQNAINKYLKARTAHNAAKEAERAALDAFRAEQRNIRRDDPAWLENLKALNKAHESACFAEVRAGRIRKAAAYIAERRIEETAVPIVAATLRKYAGKSAGPKTTEKLCKEIADAIGNGASVHMTGHFYGDAPVYICIGFSAVPLYGLKVEISAERMEKFVDSSNKFVVPTFAAVDNSHLPEDLEDWADEFERAETELEEAKKAFETKAANLRRVNLGDACLTAYRITT